MIYKFKISGKIKVETGLHIGTGGEYSAIGMVDSPVIKDTLTKRPMIPGSSLKGKIRSLIAMHKTSGICEVKNDSEEIKRLFGGTYEQKDESGNVVKKTIYSSRLIFSDTVICNDNYSRLNDMDISVTEIKYENTINRITGEANPRQMERVIRGTEFDLNIIYNLSDGEKPMTTEERHRIIQNDLDMLAIGLKLLQLDYLGGSGSRGYGRIKLDDITIEQLIIDESKKIDDNEIKEYRKILEKANV